jgi:hypothetical protein
VQRFILTIEGSNLEDVEEIELPRFPLAGEPVETRLGTCVVTRTEPLAGETPYAGRIVCRMT